MFMQPFISPSNPPVPFFPQSMQLFAPFNRPFFTNISEPPAEPIPFSFSKIQTEPPSRTGNVNEIFKRLIQLFSFSSICIRSSQFKAHDKYI